MEFERTRRVGVSVEQAWEVIADLAGYADVAPTISKVEMTDVPEVGARRRCYDVSGKGWDETCTLWEPGRAFRMEVDTSSYPLRYRALFRAFEGEWRVSPSPQGGTDITLRFVAQPRSAIAHVMLRAGRRSAFRQIDRLLDAYEEVLTGREAQQTQRSGGTAP